jgi:hypothetical protein
MDMVEFELENGVKALFSADSIACIAENPHNRSACYVTVRHTNMTFAVARPLAVLKRFVEGQLGGKIVSLDEIKWLDH